MGMLLSPPALCTPWVELYSIPRYTGIQMATTPRYDGPLTDADRAAIESVRRNMAFEGYEYSYEHGEELYRQFLASGATEEVARLKRKARAERRPVLDVLREADALKGDPQ